jgi:hypothetical protein
VLPFPFAKGARFVFQPLPAKATGQAVEKVSMPTEDVEPRKGALTEALWTGLVHPANGFVGALALVVFSHITYWQFGA